MKKRRTITLSQDILVIANALSSSGRLVFYDSIINHFLAGKSMPIAEECSPELRVAFAGALPQIRAMESKYDNGTIEKKFTGKTKATLCPSGGSEIKRNEANGSEPYNNIYPFPNLIYIFNKYITTNQSTARACEKTFKQTMVASAEEVLSKLRSENQQLYQYFYTIIQTIDKSGAVNIYGTPVPSSKIIQTILELVQNPNFQTVLDSARNKSSEANVRDSIKYSITYLYNQANGVKNKQKQQKPPSQDFKQRDYSQEDLSYLFDNLDDIQEEDM